MSSQDDIDLSDWEKVDPLHPIHQASLAGTAPARQLLASSTSALLHSKGTARRPLAFYSRSQQAAGHPATPQRSPRIWIAGILTLSAFWCFVSLLAISRLERKLPSEMQEQLEFHTAFSGLWRKAQGAAAGLIATNATMHHLPFAEASLSHKHRKRVGPAEQPYDSSDVNDGASAQESQSFAAGEYLYQQQPPATADIDEKEEGDVRWFLLEPAINTLKQALAAEQSQRGFMRGLRSMQTHHKQRSSTLRPCEAC